MTETAQNSPISLGDTINEMFELRERKRELNAELKDIEQAIRDLEGQILQGLDEQGVQQTRTGRATATISEQTIPSVQDWDAVYDYVRENEAQYLFERRLAAGAWRELHESGETVPGTEPYVRRTVNLRRR